VKLSAPAANYSIFLYNPIHRQALANAGYEGILVFSLARQVTWLLPFHAVQIHLVASFPCNANRFGSIQYHANSLGCFPLHAVQVWWCFCPHQPAQILVASIEMGTNKPNFSMSSFQHVRAWGQPFQSNITHIKYHPAELCFWGVRDDCGHQKNNHFWACWKVHDDEKQIFSRIF